MSYILDALRRAESERANEKKAPGLHDQPLEPLLQPQHARPAKSPWLWMLAGGGIVLLGALAWAWFARTPDHPAPVAREATPPVATAPAAPGAASPPPAPGIAQGTPVAVAPVVLAPAASQPVAQEAPPTPAAAVQPPPRVLPPPKAEPAAAAAEDAHVPTLAELPDAIRRALPPLHVEATVYSNDPASRMLMLNGQMLREGEAAGDGLTVERIKPSSAVLNYRGQRFELTRQ